MVRRVSTQEIARHSQTDDIWIVVNGKVYNVTKFAPEHPGGRRNTHSPALIKDIDESIVRDLDTATITEEWTEDEAREPTGPASGNYERPALEDIINLDDFELVAMKTFSPKSWAYNSGAANDCFTRDANRDFFRHIWLRPAVIRDVSTVKTQSTFFGCELEIPIFISPVGAAKTSHEEGELALARGAAGSGIIHCISTMSSYSLAEVLDETPQQAFYQLYINKDRSNTEALVRQAQKTGKVEALFITADLPVMSKRAADERIKPEKRTAWVNIAKDNKPTGKKNAGLAKSNSSFIDSSLNWDNLCWLRGISDLPIVLKGVQRAEDARLAMQFGFDGIVISNHGGRAADTSPPAILILLEIHRYCPEVFGMMKVLVDGGFRRGSDVVKAICLGASAVGLGKSFAFALNYGQDGVEHAVSLIREEIETATQLVGMTDLMRDANPVYINTAGLDLLLPPNYGVSTGDNIWRPNSSD